MATAAMYRVLIFSFCMFFPSETKKYLKKISSGVLQQDKDNMKMADCSVFFHPDCTVGPGIAPDHAIRLADWRPAPVTAGRESNPALKTDALYHGSRCLTSIISEQAVI
jgi:hypothetical protein